MPPKRKNSGKGLDNGAVPSQQNKTRKVTQKGNMPSNTLLSLSMIFPHTSNVSGLLQMSCFICLLLEAFPLAPTRWRMFLASNVSHADAIKHRLKAISMADVITVALLQCIQNVGHANAIKDRHEYKSIYIWQNWHFDYLFTFAWPAMIHQIGHPAGESIQPMLFWTCAADMSYCLLVAVQTYLYLVEYVYNVLAMPFCLRTGNVVTWCCSRLLYFYLCFGLLMAVGGRDTLQNVGNLVFHGKTSKIEWDSTKWDSVVWRASWEKSGIIGSDWRVGKHWKKLVVIGIPIFPGQ